MSGKKNMSAVEAAKKWGVGRRTVTVLCSEGRVPGAEFIGNSWAIPVDAKKPADARIKHGKYIKGNAPNLPDSLSDAFKSFLVNPELMFQFFDMFPFPVEIFKPDGTAIYINRALMEMWRIPDANKIVGVYNVKYDPESIKKTGQKFIDQMLEGEAFRLSDISAPTDDLIERGVAEEKAFDAGFLDIYSIPVWDGDKFMYAICMFVVRETYKGKLEVAKAINYMNDHWADEFDLDKIAQAATLSRRHLQRMFKDVTRMTAYDYYKNKKIEKLKERLLDPDLNITEAFAACGVDSTGTWFNIFKKSTGESPSEFRKKNSI